MNVMPLTLAAVFVGVTLTAGTAHADPKAEAVEAKPVVNEKTGSATSVSRPPVKTRKPQATKLPREWVWRRYAKTFDGMYRQPGKKMVVARRSRVMPVATATTARTP